MKKWFPYLALLATILLLIWIKTHQRGSVASNDNAPSIQNLSFSHHARCRMDCRHISEEEIKNILQHGHINREKTEISNKGTSYAMEGEGDNKERLRIVYSPHEDKTVIVTVIDLDHEWPCNCN